MLGEFCFNNWTGNLRSSRYLVRLCFSYPYAGRVVKIMLLGCLNWKFWWIINSNISNLRFRKIFICQRVVSKMLVSSSSTSFCLKLCRCTEWIKPQIKTLFFLIYLKKWHVEIETSQEDSKTWYQAVSSRQHLKLYEVETEQTLPPLTQ